MKIYRLLYEERSISCIFSNEKNKLSSSDFLNKYMPDINSDMRFENWDVSHFCTKRLKNRVSKPRNIMHYDLLFAIADEKSKAALENRFSDCIQFLDAVNDDAPSEKYYFLNPFRSVEGLDFNKSECSFIPDSRIPSSIYKYVFREDVEYYPIFKLKHEGNVHSMRMYVTDEFKDFIESNGITGLVFEKLYDFENLKD